MIRASSTARPNAPVAQLTNNVAPVEDIRNPTIVPELGPQAGLLVSPTTAVATPTGGIVRAGTPVAAIACVRDTLAEHGNTDEESFHDVGVDEGGDDDDDDHGAVGRDGPLNQTNLFITALPAYIQDAELNKLFEPFGAIESAKVMLNIRTGKSRRFAFVKYYDPIDARNAMMALDGFVLGGDQPPQAGPNNTAAGNEHPPLHTIGVRYANSVTLLKLPTPTRKVFICNVPCNIKYPRLRAYFSRYGEVMEVKIRLDASGGGLSREQSSEGPSPHLRNDAGSVQTTTRRIVYVTFKNQADAEAAAQALHLSYPFEECGEVPLLAKLAETVSRRKERLAATRSEISGHVSPAHHPHPSPAVAVAAAGAAPPQLHGESHPLPLQRRATPPLPLPTSATSTTNTHQPPTTLYSTAARIPPQQQTVVPQQQPSHPPQPFNSHNTSAPALSRDAGAPPLQQLLQPRPLSMEPPRDPQMIWVGGGHPTPSSPSAAPVSFQHYQIPMHHHTAAAQLPHTTTSLHLHPQHQQVVPYHYGTGYHPPLSCEGRLPTVSGPMTISSPLQSTESLSSSTTSLFGSMPSFHSVPHLLHAPHAQHSHPPPAAMLCSGSNNDMRHFLMSRSSVPPPVLVDSSRGSVGPQSMHGYHTQQHQPQQQFPVMILVPNDGMSSSSGSATTMTGGEQQQQQRRLTHAMPLFVTPNQQPLQISQQQVVMMPSAASWQQQANPLNVTFGDPNMMFVPPPMPPPQATFVHSNVGGASPFVINVDRNHHNNNSVHGGVWRDHPHGDFHHQ